MKRERLKVLLDRAYAKQERAFSNFQETGESKYKAQSNLYEEQCEVLQIALSAEDDHNTLIGLRSTLAKIAGTVRRKETKSDLERELLAICDIYKI